MKQRTCTRRVEFDAAHRVMKHESKCRNLHGHRYAVDLTCEGGLDELGRVIDFSVIKSVFGAWVDTHLDHGTIVNEADQDLINLCRTNKWKLYLLDSNPTAEVMSEFLAHKAQVLLKEYGVKVSALRLYETPNCWSDWYSE
tara:strand:- start:15 stop:437 length:423 start_codon:yes stop_codon:yes gene_type:complete